METKKTMDIAVRAGEILLNSGAEIFRVEDTIARICSSYSVNCESFVLPTAIFVSTFENGYESVTTLKRIQQRTVDLKRVELINSFSRRLQQNPLPYDEAMKILDEISRSSQYRFITRFISSGITAFVYTFLFRGILGEAVAALVISMLIFLVKEKVLQIGFFQFFEFFLSGIIAGGLSLLTVKFFPGLNIYKILIGAVMILVPGVAITNGIKDALYGDIVSGMFRLAEAAFISSAVAVGVGVMLSLGLPWV